MVYKPTPTTVKLRVNQTEVMEDAFDLVKSDALGMIKPRWKEPPERYSLQVPSSPGLELVFFVDCTRATGVRLSEYRAPVGLFTRDVFHGLGLDMNLLGQGPDKGERGRGSSRYTYPASILAPNGRVSDRTHGYTKVVVRSPANRLAHVERCEQRVAIHWREISETPSHGWPYAHRPIKK